MRNLWFCIFGCTLIAPARAQPSPAEVAVNVTFRDNGAAHNGQNSILPKLFFKNTPLDVIRVDTPPLAPLHVVFVLDSDTHQRTLMKTSLDYVAGLAAAIHDSRPKFTIVAAANSLKFSRKPIHRREFRPRFGRWIPVQKTTVVCREVYTPESCMASPSWRIHRAFEPS